VGSQFGYRLTENQQLNLSATFNQAKDTEFPALPMDLRSDKTWLLRIGHSMDFDGSNFKSWQTSAYGSYVDHKMDNFDKVLNPRRMNAATKARTKSSGLRSELIWQYKHSKLYSGIDFRYESANGNRSREFLIGPNAGRVVDDNVWNGGIINKTAVFAEYHYSLNSIRLILSARMESNLAQATDPDIKFSEKNTVSDVHQWNPNMSIGGIFSISDAANLGIWLGRAQRSGSLTERYINSFPVGLDAYDMLGNPQLKPESNTQMDVIYEFKNQDVSLNATVFAGRLYNHISAEIDTSLTPVMPSSPGVRRYVNLEDALMAGFEISWQQSLYGDLAHNLSIAYTYGQDMSRAEPLPEIAPLEVRYELLGYFYANTLRPVVTFRYVHAQNRVSQVFGEQNTPAFTVLDAVVLYQLNPDIHIRFGVENIFNRSYFEHLSRIVKGQERPIYAPGRNYFVSLALNFM
jgi:iron complex outermembrane receptor protein